MIDPSTAASNSHATASFWLDVADKFIKFLAVLVGAAWTWMNYRRSRTYAQKLELLIAGNVVSKRGNYVEISAGLKNLGASRYEVQQEGTACELIAILGDLSERSVRLFSVFESHNRIEPGETIGDLMQCKIPLPIDEIVWLKMHLRVISGRIEWNSSCPIKVD